MGEREKITTSKVREKKLNGEKITMLTAYDYTTAKIIDESGIELILIGDSAGNIMSGYQTTVYVNMDQMLMHTEWVKRAVKYGLIISDMPFLSYQVSIEKAIENAGKFLKAGAEAVKLEGGEEIIEIVRKLIGFGIPVMGHLGLTPQSVHHFGGYKVQGKNDESAKKMMKDAKLLDEAGVFAIVLEKIPSELGKKITESVNCATIGIGAGKHTDGQVLVSSDLLGLTKAFKPKFLRKYANCAEIYKNAFQNYINDVKNLNYPSDEESY